jgi:hypothetical protein
MRRISIVAASAALLAALPGAAAATAPSPMKQAYSLGRCIAGEDRGAAGALLRSLPLADTAVPISAAGLGGASDCLKGTSPTVSSLVLRGAIAQALLLRDFPHFGVPPKIKEHLFVTFPLPSEMEDGPDNVDHRTAELYKLADCVVRNQAIKLEPLFRAGPGSGIENRLFDYLGPTIAACRGNGGPLRVSRPHFRAMMAQAAYNISVRYWTGKLWSAR